MVCTGRFYTAEDSQFSAALKMFGAIRTVLPRIRTAKEGILNSANASDEHASHRTHKQYPRYNAVCQSVYRGWKPLSCKDCNQGVTTLRKFEKFLIECCTLVLSFTVNSPELHYKHARCTLTTWTFRQNGRMPACATTEVIALASGTLYLRQPKSAHRLQATNE